MVQSTAANVDDYLAEVTEDRRLTLAAIRRLCQEHLPGYEESMAYGMPCYARDGVVEFAFASQKQYISIYGMQLDALDPLRDAFAGAKFGKGCIRYTKPEKVNLEAVAKLLQATAAAKSGPC